VTNKFLDYNMLLNSLSLLKVEIHNANKGQTTAGIFFSTKFSAWTSGFRRAYQKTGLARLSAVRLFISRKLSLRQAFSIIAFLVLNLICSLT